MFYLAVVLEKGQIVLDTNGSKQISASDERPSGARSLSQKAEPVHGAAAQEEISCDLTGRSALIRSNDL